MSTFDINHLRKWIGKCTESSDILTPALATRFLATFDETTRVQNDSAAPLGIHWCLCQSACLTSELERDGHPPRGDFLPSAPLPHRMWAGGQVEWRQPLKIGDEIVRHSVIEDVAAKEGGSGHLCFVTVRNNYRTQRGLSITERQDLVFRDATLKSAAPRLEPAPDDEGSDILVREVDASTALLFRYSALTFNTHRIHYDQAYATDTENYPGLVVHGPLQATLLLRHLNGQFGVAPKSFGYRSVRPLVAGSRFRIYQRMNDPGLSDLRIVSSDNIVTMKATAEYEPSTAMQKFGRRASSQ